MKDSKAQIVARLFDCWKRADLEGALALISDDAVFEPDLKSPRVQGRAAIREAWAGFMKIIKSYEYEIKAILEGDDLVMVERVEWLRTERGATMTLPILGVLRFDAQNRIVAWRDYWDTSMVPAG